MADDANLPPVPPGVTIGGSISGDLVAGDKHVTYNAADDVIGRDQIINNIQNFASQALSAAEEAHHARAFERQHLAQGVGLLLERLQTATVSPVAGAGAGNPYKGLLEYRLGDAGVFFGRARAVSELLRQLEQGPLTVLHSESGAGKTSLLQAGLAPRLIAAGQLPVYLRSHAAEPGYVIKRTFMPDLEAAPLLATASLREVLSQVGAVLGPRTGLYLLLDQFEEFFTQVLEPAQSEFVRQLAECMDDASLNVRWLLAVRTEYFGNLASFRPWVRNPFANDFRLNRLTRAEAQDVILRPAEARGVTFEPGLIDRLLDDLGQDLIAPPQLQLVCSSLFKELEPGETTLTQAIYEREGGAAGILRGHLERVLSQDLPREQRPAARRLLEALTSSELRRVQRTQVELEAELTARGIIPATLDSVLNQLVESRLIKQVATEAGPAYELAHDYLLQEIQLDPVVQARKAAQELLEQEVRAYRRHHTLLSAERLKLIAPYQADFHLSAEAGQLLAESQAAAQRDQQAEDDRRQRELADARQLAAETEARRQAEAERARVVALSAEHLLRRNRIITAVSVLALIGAVAAGVLGFSSAQNANTAVRNASTAQAANTQAEQNLNLAQTAGTQAARDREAAERQGQIALARQLAAQAEQLIVSQPAALPRVLLLAIESSQRFADAASSQALLNGLRLMPWEVAGLVHNGLVTRVAFSPNGRQVVSGSSDGTVWVWDATTGHENARMTHDGGVSSLAFSPDGRWVVSGGHDATVRVWDAVTGQELARMDQGFQSILAVAFSPDGRWVVSGGWDATARVWDAVTGQELAIMEHDGAVTQLAFSADGRRVASGSLDGTARVWDAATGQELARLTHDQRSWVNAVAFSPDGRWVVSGGWDATARVWDAATGQELARMDQDDVVTALAFSPDGQQVASASLSGIVRVWNAATGLELAHMTHPKAVHSIAFSPDGQRVLSGSEDGTARLWDAATGVELARMSHQEAVLAVAFSPTGQQFVSGSEDGTVKVWEAATGQGLAYLTHDSAVLAVGFSPNGRQVVSHFYDTAWVRDAATGQELARVPHPSAGYRLALSPDGRQVVSGDYDGSVRIWDAATGQDLVQMAHDGIVYAVAFRSDGRQVVSGSSEGTVRVWDAATGQELARLTGEDSVDAVALSPDGSRVVSGNMHGTLQVWDVSAGQEVARMTHDDAVSAVVFSPNGKQFASGSDDRTVRVWDLATGQEVARMAHDDAVFAVAFSADGQQLMSGSWDKTARVWDAATGQEAARMTHDDVVNAVAFSADGQQLVSGSRDGTLWLWWWRPEKLIALACSRLRRNLTHVEWAQYLGSEPYQRTCANLPDGE